MKTQLKYLLSTLMLSYKDKHRPSQYNMHQILKLETVQFIGRAYLLIKESMDDFFKNSSFFLATHRSRSRNELVNIYFNSCASE